MEKVSTQLELCSNLLGVFRGQGCCGTPPVPGREGQGPLLLLLCAPALIPLCGSVQWQQLGMSHGPLGCPWWETLPCVW